MTARLCGWRPSLESISGVNKLTANPVGLRTHKRIICRGGETAYALVSGTSDRKVVWVQIPSSAPKTCCRSGFCASHNNALPCNPHCGWRPSPLARQRSQVSLDCISHRFHQMTRSGFFIYFKPKL